MNVPRLLRTVRYLKPVQVVNRVWRLAFLRGRLADPAADAAVAPLGTFTFLNLTAEPRGWNDPRLPKLWLYNLHYFEKRCDAALIERWIAENPRGVGNGWEPYPISLRVVSWIKAGFGERYADSIREQVAYLLPRLEYHLLANHILANAKALVFAGKALGERKWYAKGMSIYARELPEQILDDGVHFELSPMYHAIILNDLIDCERLTHEPLFRDAAEKMRAGLRLLTGPDGKLAKFNDSADGIAPSPAELEKALVDSACGRAESMTPPLSGVMALGGPCTSGYLRRDAGAYVLLAKCGAIGPSYQPGHAHADTFTFELWRGTEKIVTDTGTDRYVVDAERLRQRGTAAHNTVVIGGRNSSEVWGGHRVGRRFDPKSHKRTFELTAAGLAGTDEVNCRAEESVEVRFHLPPGVTAAIACDGGERFEEPCKICVEFGRQVEGRCVGYRFRGERHYVIRWTVS